MIYIDSNIVYNILFQTELTHKAREVFKMVYGFPLVSSTIVVNELLYVVSFKLVKDAVKISSRYEFKEYVRERGYPERAVELITQFFEDFKITIIHDYSDYKELVEIAKRFRLLPNDAQIALTCRHYGINTIATLDEDFRRVPWLRVVP